MENTLCGVHTKNSQAGTNRIRYSVDYLKKLMNKIDDNAINKINFDAPGIKSFRDTTKKDTPITNEMIGSIAGKFQEILNKMTIDNYNILITETLKLKFEDSEEMMQKIIEILYNKIVDEPYNNHLYIRVLLGIQNKNFKERTIFQYFITLAKNNFDDTFKFKPQELSDMYFDKETSGEDISDIDKLVKKKCGLMRVLIRMYLEKVRISYSIIENCFDMLLSAIQPLKNNDHENFKHFDDNDNDDKKRYKYAISYLYGSMLYDMLMEGSNEHKIIKHEDGNLLLCELKEFVPIRKKINDSVQFFALSIIKNNLKSILNEKYNNFI
jgi:hypothetical protein